jgi:hypothetical protein
MIIIQLEFLKSTKIKCASLLQFGQLEWGCLENKIIKSMYQMLISFHCILVLSMQLWCIKPRNEKIYYMLEYYQFLIVIKLCR